MHGSLTNGVAWKIVKSISKRLATLVDLLTSPRLMARTLWALLGKRNTCIFKHCRDLSDPKDDVTRVFEAVESCHETFQPCRFYAPF